MINDVAQKIAVALLPKLFAGLGVEAGENLLQVRTVADIAHDIKVAIGDDRSGLTGQVRRPQRMSGLHFVWQVFFEGSAVLVRSAPGQPAVDRGGICRRNNGKLTANQQAQGAGKRRA